MNLEKTKRILVVMGHLFDSGSPFFLLPKELTSVITTLTYFNFAIVKNITKKGGSSPFYLDESRSDPIFSLNSHNGGMATAQCEMDSKDEVIVWECRVDQCNNSDGHLRFGLMRTSNLTKEDEATIMRMFIGYKLQKSIQNPNLYVNEFVLANYALKVPDDYLIHRNFSINTRYRVGSLVGFIFNRKEGVLIMLHNGRKILQLDHVPCECPLEWFPAFSVGPYNQITLCQDISFDVHKIISQDLEKDPNQKTDNNNFNCTVKPVFMFGRS